MYGFEQSRKQIFSHLIKKMVLNFSLVVMLRCFQRKKKMVLNFSLVVMLRCFQRKYISCKYKLCCHGEISTFQIWILNILHAWLLPYENSHNLVAYWSDHFWRSYFPFCPPKVCSCNSSYILNRNSSKLYMVTHYHMKIHILHGSESG
jgi:hypothetical protein